MRGVGVEAGEQESGVRTQGVRMGQESKGVEESTISVIYGSPEAPEA